MSERIASALDWLEPTIRMNCFLENSMHHKQNNLTTVVLPKPRGSPTASWVKSPTFFAASQRSCQSALNTGGNKIVNTSGRAKPASISISVSASWTICCRLYPSCCSDTWHQFWESRFLSLCSKASQDVGSYFTCFRLLHLPMHRLRWLAHDVLLSLGSGEEIAHQ